MSSCDFLNLSMSDLFVVYIEIKFEMFIKIFNLWIDCDFDVLLGDLLVVLCLEEYRCGVGFFEGDFYSIYIFCNFNCVSGIIEYLCIGFELVFCENFIFVVIENCS